AIERFGTPVKRYARPFSLGSGSDPLTQWFSNAPEQKAENEERPSVVENAAENKSELIENVDAAPESDNSERRRNFVVPLTLGIVFTGFVVWGATRRFKRLQKTAV
ncbi:MAG: hypothetical protein ACKVKP_03260, partial [Acidimicrobiales bacterium]